MEIRPVRPEEHTELADLTVAAYRHSGYDEDGYEEELRDVAGRASGAEVLVLVDDDGRIVGGVTFVPDHASPYAEFDAEHACGIRMLAVHPDAQGQGVGEALATECIGRARRLGRHEVILHSARTMRAAQHIYERLGFERDPNLDWWPNPTVELLGFRLHLS
ncbi:GNAT family N-acetyltransferase [Actinomarinicola tropica]|uniref:GNAT family N-acetyltransferase n=1 Tax=Actinomarinicola tropica TaxID=2789776 RepID=A0A5Q2RJL5_9ACTN|nr:GNAT family N-acetyltransferase [Actinomarinicola tropica]QGG95092.1 GNAT family N-acetyltransferase [Actinomarinicola tropica]